MGHLLRDAFTLPAGFGPTTMAIGINLYETNESYILQAVLPGVNAEQLTITAHRNLLTLQGTTEIAAPQGARSLFVSVPTGDFREQLQLPSDVDADQATADYQDGVLTLTLPKAEATRTRTIKVGGGQQQQAIEGKKK
jgi:HSP20 family protein